MIRYYANLQLTFAEIKNASALLIHSLGGCIFHCHQCLNYDELIIKKHPHALSIDQVVETIQLDESLLDVIILSGGEYLISPLEEMIHDLKCIREVTNKPIIIYTTGYFLEKMKILVDMKLVDGFHIDMKLPYHLLTEEDQELIQLTLGKNISIDQIHTMLDAIQFVIQTDQGYSQVRSVKYPFLDSSAFTECSLYISELRAQYHKNTPYEAHPFISLTMTK